MNQKVIALAGATLLLILGCLTAQNNLNALELKNYQQNLDPKIMSQSTGPNLEQTLATSRTNFGLNLFSQLRMKSKNQNIFISPSSVAIALSMVYNGSDGDTKLQIQKALQLQGTDLENFNLATQKLSESLASSDPKVKLAIANSLWLKEGFNFVPEFLKINQKFFSAKVTEIDFADSTSVSVINNWVKENTNSKIEEIVDSLNPDDVLYLINAIYFKGLWSEPFDVKLTRNKPFTLATGNSVEVPLMQQTGNFLYSENEQFQAVSIPYGDRRFSMYIFLPKEGQNLESFLNNLNPENWQKWIRTFRRTDGTLEIPRFKIEYEADLISSLKNLGIESAFSDKANFSRMTSTQVLISAVKHKTFVEVNEEGTEAAAATSIGIRATSIMPSTPFNLIVNRPFFSVIKDNQTGEILFMGAIYNPK